MPTVHSLAHTSGQGWDPAWDRRKVAMASKAPKGRRHDRLQAGRVEAIGRGLAEQSEKVAAHKKTLPPRQRRDSIVYQLTKKEVWERE